MALIVNEKIFRCEKGRNFIHREVECTYTSFVSEDKSKYLQLDTYGSDDRKIKNKISQSIQLNKESAKYLMKIIQDEFDL